MPRQLVGLLVISCLFVTVQSTARRGATFSPTLHSTHYSYPDGFTGHFASEIFTDVPRGGETTRGTDELSSAKIQSAHYQPRYPFSLISAFRILHKKSMLVKEDDDEEEKLEFVLREEEMNEPSSAAVEGSTSFGADFVDEGENGSSNFDTGRLKGKERTVEAKDSQMAEFKGNASRVNHHSQKKNSLSKSRRTHRSITQKKNVKRDRRRQSRSRRIGLSNNDVSTGEEDEKIGIEEYLDRNKDSSLSTDLHRNGSYVLEETKTSTIEKDDFTMSLKNHSAECKESLYISSGHVSIVTFALN